MGDTILSYGQIGMFLNEKEIYQTAISRTRIIPKRKRVPFQFKLKLSFNNQVIKTLASYLHIILHTFSNCLMGPTIL